MPFIPDFLAPKYENLLASKTASSDERGEQTQPEMIGPGTQGAFLPASLPDFQELLNGPKTKSTGIDFHRDSADHHENLSHSFSNLAEQYDTIGMRGLAKHFGNQAARHYDLANAHNSIIAELEFLQDLGR